MSYRRRPGRRLPRDDPGRLAALRLLAAIGTPDRAIARHLKITEGYVWHLRSRHGVPSGQVARRWLAAKPIPQPPRGPVDLEDTGEL